MAKTTVSQYIKNVGKSVAYATIDVTKEQIPNISDFVEESNDIVKDSYAKVSSFIKAMKSGEKDIRKTKIYSTVKDVANNFIEDIKTGNFYNEREMEIDMGFEDFDMDDSGSTSSSKPSITSDTKVLDNSITSAANMQTAAIARSTDITVNATMTSTKVTVAQMEKVGAGISANIGVIYQSIEKANNFLNKNLATHINNSSKYYDTTTKLLQEQVAMTKQILEMQYSLYQPDKSKKSKETLLSESMSSSGGFKLSGYMKNIKNNFENSLFGMMFGMTNMLDGFGENAKYEALKSMASSKELMKFLTGKIIPEAYKRTLKSLDDGFGNLFANMISKINYKSKHGGFGDDIKDILYDLLKIDIRKRDEIKTNGYARGAIPFDGETKKTIVEVIPGYLAKIEAAITGMDERYYDLSRGSWIKAKEIKNKFASLKEDNKASANYEIRNSMQELINVIAQTDAKAAKRLEKSMITMINKIYEDDGYFAPYDIDKIGGNTFRVSNFAKYGFTDEKTFHDTIAAIGKDKIRKIAASNMHAKESHARTLDEIEKSGYSIYNQLFNNNIGGKNPSGIYSKFGGGVGLLALSTDESGNNVFWYLKNILDSIRGHSYTGKVQKPKSKKGKSRNRAHNASSNSSASSGTSEGGESNPDSEDNTDYDSISNAFKELDEKKAKEKEKEDDLKAKKEALLKYLDETLGDSPLGQFFKGIASPFIKGGSFATLILRKPFDAITRIVEKADESLYKVMFGEPFKDDQGEEIKSVFGYMVYKVKSTFEDAGDWIKNKLEDKLFNPIEGWFRKKFIPFWENYGVPVTDEIKAVGSSVKNRVKEAFGNTFGKVYNKAKENMTEEVGNYRNYKKTKDDVKSLTDKVREELNRRKQDKPDEGDIATSAYGRIVSGNKPILTMMSPGEIVWNPKDEAGKARDLKREKKERSRLSKLFGLNTSNIDLNAEGNVDDKDRGIEDRIAKTIKKIVGSEKFQEISSYIKEAGGAKIGASGVLGAGFGFLTGFNPIITGILGSGISFIKENKRIQDLLFGKRTEEGREGGLIPEKIVNFFDKSSKDLIDFGVAGGVLGLITPFGLLGGAGIGAGVAMLKNSETFKKIMFGDEATGKEGLISKELYNKFKEKLKKATPNMAAGAILGVLTGPFGLLGNSIMGAGLGLLTSTQVFNKFMFGEDGEGGGLSGAIKDGIVVPLKNTIGDILNKLKEFGKKHVLDPLKNFWDPFKQGIQNIISGIGNGIKDRIADSFEKHVGLPFRDFIQQKVFKPISSIFKWAVLKPAQFISQALIGGPAHLLGAIGNDMRLGQIRKGRAYDMTAQQRIDFRNQHSKRQGFRNFFFKDQMLETDNLLANMGEADLESLYTMANSSLNSRKKLGQDYGNAKKKIGLVVSDFVNAKDENGKSLYDKGTKYNLVNKLTKAAQSGNYEEVQKILNNKKLKWSDEQKDDFLSKISSSMNESDMARKALESADIDISERDAKLEALLGRKFKGRRDMRQLMKSAKFELDSKRKQSEIESGEENSDAETPIEKLNKAISDESDGLIKTIKITNDYLCQLVKEETPNAEDLSSEEGANNLETRIKARVAEVKEQLNILDGVDEDSKEYNDAQKKAEEEEIEDDEELNATKETAEILSSMHDKFFGKKKDKNKSSIFDKIGGFFGGLASGVGSIFKYLGISGKAILGAGAVVGGISLFGHATDWLKQKVTPWFEEKVIPKLKDLFLGEKGVLTKIRDYFTSGNFGDDISRVITFIASGLEKCSDTIAPIIATIVGKTIGVLIKNFPKILFNVGQAINDGYKNAGNTPLSRDNQSYEPVASTITSDNSTTIEYDKNGNILTEYTPYEEGRSLLGTIGHGFGRATAKGIITGKGGVKLFTKLAEKSPKIVQKAASGAAKATLGGRILTGVAKGADGIISSGKNFGAFIHKGLGKLDARVTKNAADAAYDEAYNLFKTEGYSSATIEAIEKYNKKAALAADVAEKFAKESVEEVVEKTAKNTILSRLKGGIKNVFSSLVDSKVGTWILDKALAIGRPLSYTILKEQFEKLGEKLAVKAGENFFKSGVKKLGGKVLNALAGVSPLAIALWIVDFLHGINNAYTFLEIPDSSSYKLNWGQRIAVALAYTINERILFGLIPISAVLDLFTDFILPLFGMDTSELKKAQEEASDVLDAWNKTHPEEQYDSIEAYNKSFRFGGKNWWKKITGQLSTIEVGSGSSRSGSASESVINKYKNSGSGKNNNNYSGSGHIFQKHPSIANIKYGNGTIGSDGCAPVAAANVINRISGRGNNVLDAASYAVKNGMTSPEGGTDIGYFGSYFNSKGISSETTSSKNKVDQAINSGHQVVMLGKDSYSNGPFGRGNHFITAVGKDRNGNIIVEDPDLPQRTAKYSRNAVMGSMKKSVITGSRKNSGRGRVQALASYHSDGGGTTSYGGYNIAAIAKSQVGTGFSDWYDSKTYNKYMASYYYDPEKQYGYGNLINNKFVDYSTIFIWWVFNSAGASKLFMNGGKTDDYDTLYEFCKKSKNFDNHPRIGDIVFVRTTSKLNLNLNHVDFKVGIVTSVNKNGMQFNAVGVGCHSNDPGAITRFIRQLMPGEDSSHYDTVYLVEEYTNLDNMIGIGFYHPSYPYKYETPDKNLTAALEVNNKYSLSKDYTSGIDVANKIINVDTSSTDNTDISNTSTGELSLFDKLTKLGKAALDKFYGGAFTSIFGENNEEGQEDSDSSTSSSTQNTINNAANTIITNPIMPEAINTISKNEYNVDPDTMRSINYTSDSSLKGKDNREKIWNYFRSKGYSPAGTAGLMGNIAMESGFKPNNVENFAEASYGDDDKYTSLVDNGTYSRDTFVHKHGFGYGLPGFTYYTLKDNLYKNTVEAGRSLGDLEGQLNAMYDQLSNTYVDLHERLKTTTSVEEASNDVLKNYERPRAYQIWESNPQHTPGIRTINDRRAASEDVYNEFGSARIDGASALSNMNSYHVSSNGRSSNISSMSDSVDYTTFMKTIVEVLITISGNTALLTKILEVLSSKFNLEIDKTDIENASKEGRIKAKQSLSNLINRSVNNAQDFSKYLNSNDTEYILSVMTGLARE